MIKTNEKRQAIFVTSHKWKCFEKAALLIGLQKVAPVISGILLKQCCIKPQENAAYSSHSGSFRYISYSDRIYIVY